MWLKIENPKRPAMLPVGDEDWNRRSSVRRSSPSAMVTFCLAKAAECRRWAELTTDGHQKEAWLATEGQWFYLARSYESERRHVSRAGGWEGARSVIARPI